MRIIAGKYRGRRLFVPKGRDVRPTGDRVKEAIFSILGRSVDGAVVLDLFAGSGSLGLEALSRGAKRAVFVDNRSESLAAVKRNLEALGLESQKVVKSDLRRGCESFKDEGPFDLLFLDPPYGKDLAPGILNLVARTGIISDGACAVVEHGLDEDLSGLDSCWSVDQVRTYGQTSISFLSYSERAA